MEEDSMQNACQKIQSTPLHNKMKDLKHTLYYVLDICLVGKYLQYVFTMCILHIQLTLCSLRRSSSCVVSVSIDDSGAAK